MLFSVNWWPWLEQLREEAHSGRDWLADEYWIATCLRKYWIATALRLRKGPAEQGRKFKTWGKVSWLWAITRRKIQIYGKLALAGEKALPSSVVCHIERDFYLHCSMDGYLCGTICGNNWGRTYNTLPILLESNMTTVAHKSAIFKYCPFTEFSQ